MNKGNTRWVVASVGLGAVLAVVFALTGRDRRPPGSGESGGAGANGGWRGFQGPGPGSSGTPEGANGSASAGGPGMPGAGPAGGAGRDVPGTMTAWRNAILNRNADAVVMLDRAFLDERRVFTPALVDSAKGDPNERVRAFSTRVLGKVRDVALVETYAALLEDASPYVRQNAAWALGELGSEAEGRAAAQRATAELRRLGRRDKEPDVRVAANDALKRLQ